MHKLEERYKHHPTQLPAGLESTPLDVTLTTAFTKTLDYVTEEQKQEQWCWAATAVSIAFFFDRSSTFTQCKLANSHLGQTNCCEKVVSAACNKPYLVDVALSSVGRFSKTTTEAPDFAGFREEIDNGRPLCSRVAWTGGGGAHVVTFYGYTLPHAVYIADSAYGYSVMNFADFPAKYASVGGTWTHTYWTKA